MRVAFISSAYRTVFFHGLEADLRALGHEVLWICPGERWAAWLSRQGVAESRILSIAAHGTSWGSGTGPTADDLSRLARLEREGSLSINDLLEMDTLLKRRRRRAYSLRYFAVCAALIERFLTENRIQAIFAEQTWGVELLAGLVAEDIGLPFLKPHTVRFPRGRFGFFPGYSEATLDRGREPDEGDKEVAEEMLSAFVERKPQPDYVATDREVLRLRPERLRKLLAHVRALAGDPFDETSRRPLGLIADHSRQWIRKRVNRALSPVTFESLSDIASDPFVYFPLHLQPEASIDVKGRPHTDQIAAIRAISRTTPVGHAIVVKEHPEALHRRPRRFYADLKAIPGVRLAGPGVPTFELIEKAALTIAITGTAAYEAALLGRRAATLAPIFFEEIVTAPRFDPRVDSVRSVIEDGLPATWERRCAFLSRIVAASHPGTVGDAFWQPESLAPANLRQVAEGIHDWCEAHLTGSLRPL
ncbi:MAG TPA: hypothetical protein VK837_14030 [Longimicrobiales bacterium]|nr:hypothetical protein [Longimicrobiales bacterium]